ncbi:MAG: LysM peptidoglycan-binding domain-containing protein [Candidatus Riflebacteria bacterium]|nr:LysM peptidoglycan-binding domain-containing protein [Candidatus Riflebacteria bacterium]
MLPFLKKKKPEYGGGLFLVFVFLLFLLQVTFAFKIHGDIGPGKITDSGKDQLAPPVLIGKIDAILSAQTSPQMEKLEPMASRDNKKELQIETGNDKTRHYLDYFIKSGDNLETISRKLYGNNKMVSALIRINRLTDIKNLRDGEILRVPKVGLIASAK